MKKSFEIMDNKNIKSIKMRKIGLLDVFGKIEIDITFNNNSIKKYVAISPVDTKIMVYELWRTKL